MKISCKLLIILIILVFSLGLVWGYEFKITKIGPNYVMATLKVQKGKPRPKFEILMIYDVFEKMEIIDGKRVFINYIDSVYLRDVKKEELYFGYTWEGEKKLLNKNYILSSTERYYAFPDTSFDQIMKEPDIEITEERESTPLPKAPVFAFMILGGYSLLHTLRHDGTVDPGFGPGYITTDLVVFLPFDLGLRLTGAIRDPYGEIYVQASGINYKGLANSFIKVYTELGAGYPLSISDTPPAVDPSLVIFAQYGVLFDFKAIAKWGWFAIDIYVNGNFPIDTILEDMYLNYGIKAGVRF